MKKLITDNETVHHVCQLRNKNLMKVIAESHAIPSLEMPIHSKIDAHCDRKVLSLDEDLETDK